MIYFKNDFAGLRRLLKNEKSVYFIYDSAVQRYAKGIAEESWHTKAIRGGERVKTMKKAEEICRWLLSEGADRDSLVVAMGGGTITDLAGFAAGIYKRGVRAGYVPTTLLSDVDASVGGKCAVNLDGLKNEIGIFREPEFVYINSEVIDTLPQKEWQSGMGELIKTFILFDKKLFEEILRTKKCGLREIEAAVHYKEKIVEKDPTEQGLRRLLNFGHTFGHAIEAYELQHVNKNLRLTHGEAVAVGMCFAAKLSGREIGEKIEKSLKELSLPTDIRGVPDEELFKAIKHDKKTYGNSIKMVLLEEIGKPYIEEIDLDDLYKRFRKISRAD